MLSASVITSKGNLHQQRTPVSSARKTLHSFFFFIEMLLFILINAREDSIPKINIGFVDYYTKLFDMFHKT